jgi:hypothetical protein
MFQSDERCIQLLDVVQNLVERTLQDAYRAAANVRGAVSLPEGGPALATPHIAERFRYTLDLIPLWPGPILDGEEERAKALDMHIQDCYAHLFDLYQQHFKVKSERPRLRDFLHEIYIQLVQLPEIRNGLYFMLMGVNRKGVIADAIRAALRSSSKPAVAGLSPGEGGGPEAARAVLPPAETRKPALLGPPPPFVATASPAPAKPATAVATAFSKIIEVDLSKTLLAPPPTFGGLTAKPRPKTKVTAAAKPAQPHRDSQNHQNSALGNGPNPT